MNEKENENGEVREEKHEKRKRKMKMKETKNVTLVHVMILNYRQEAEYQRNRECYKKYHSDECNVGYMRSTRFAETYVSLASASMTAAIPPGIPPTPPAPITLPRSMRAGRICRATLEISRIMSAGDGTACHTGRGWSRRKMARREWYEVASAALV